MAVESSSYKSFSTVQLVGFSGRDAAQKLQLIPRPPACAVIVLQGMLHRAVYDYRYVALIGASWASVTSCFYNYVHDALTYLAPVLAWLA